MRTDECGRCLRYRSDMQCDAFPKGIPEAIALGNTSHVEPFKGDGGLRFAPFENDKLRKADAVVEHVNDMVDREDIAYRRVKTALKRTGYVDSDFEPGGPLYGRSTNELLEMVRPRND